MKRFGFIMTVALSLASLQTVCAQKVSYTVSGTWRNGIGNTVRLMQGPTADELVAFDSVKVSVNSTYEMKGKVDEMKRVYVCFDGKHKRAILLDGQPIEVNYEMVAGKPKFECKGSDEQKVLAESDEKLATYCLLKFASMLSLSKAKEKGNQQHFDSLATGLDSLSNSVDRTLISYVDSVRNNYATPYYIHDLFIHYYNYDVALNAYNKLTNRVKNAATGRRLKQELDQMSQVNVGGYAPDFELNTPEGKKLSLKSLRGHIVLLDFWASWCGPCMREMPNVKQIYAKYHSKGLEVLGVSLDRERAPWLNAIKNKQLNWNHVSSLKEFECPVARLFHVTAIPRMYIIDKQGKIIAQDLRGEELAKKMDELFK